MLPGFGVGLPDDQSSSNSWWCEQWGAGGVGGPARRRRVSGGRAGRQEECHEQGAGSGDRRCDQAAAGQAVQAGEHRGVIQGTGLLGQPGVAEVLRGDRGAADRPAGRGNGGSWQACRQRGGEPAGAQGGGDAADYGHAERATEQPGGAVDRRGDAAFPVGTAPMMASVAGDWVMPSPMPKITICAAMMKSSHGHYLTLAVDRLAFDMCG